MLEKLVQLRLHSNLLTSLPDAMTALTNLEILTLRDNEIGQKAPEFLSSLDKLKTLTLGKNKMKKLPDVELQGDSAFDTNWMVRVTVCVWILFMLVFVCRTQQLNMIAVLKSHSPTLTRVSPLSWWEHFNVFLQFTPREETPRIDLSKYPESRIYYNSSDEDDAPKTSAEANGKSGMSSPLALSPVKSGPKKGKKRR